MRNSERSLRRRGRTTAVALAAGLLLAACGAGDDDAGTTADVDGNGDADGEVSEVVARYQESGVTLGVANEVPFGSIGEDGQPTGIGPDVARAVLDEMGIAINDAQVVEFGELIGGLQAGQFDIITAGMYITPDRAAQVFFSDPDYCVAESLAVPAGNPDGIEDYQSIVDNPDVTVAVATGTVEVDYVEQAGVPDDQVATFGDIESMYRALEAGEVDAVTGTLATVQTQANARDGIDAVEGFFPVTEDGEEILPCGGHAFDDEEFRDAFNEVLNRFRDDGTTTEIITAYEDFTEEDVAKANELTVDDLS
ncbi:ectoine/hydroxyectoine ABC transporter substrate-binding protein EhuB [Nitriliruptor alkaliphilus]|uniref:ectoine/hydroxyectoine ABC transporter substrate-binding protein EhuB n=1 Tax=Nitriliruptor alkaliphilus TaxID=427918 RepID=UPI000698D80D|nr:ectoine/hydroxyectoine ABC transporter substrate-binding protein EhuB [Nitriliruptor alkaliphilus]